MIMKHIILNWRYWLLGIMGIMSFVLLVGEPATESTAWLADLLKIKLAGSLLIVACFCLANRWQKNGKLNELTKYVNETDY